MAEASSWQRLREKAPYAPEAFRFVQEGLQHTLAALRRRGESLGEDLSLGGGHAAGGAGAQAFDADELDEYPLDAQGGHGVDGAELLGEGGEGSEGGGTHVSGQELCLGLRALAVEKYGLLARTVLHGWGVRSTEDFGKIVYAMVDAGLLRTSEDDSMEDFQGVYDFDEAFESLPARALDVGSAGVEGSDGGQARPQASERACPGGATGTGGSGGHGGSGGVRCD